MSANVGVWNDDFADMADAASVDAWEAGGRDALHAALDLVEHAVVASVLSLPAISVAQDA